MSMRRAPHLGIVMAMPAGARLRRQARQSGSPSSGTSGRSSRSTAWTATAATTAPKGKLDLRLKRFAERGGESGPAIVAGKPDESYLLDRLHDAEMPPGEKKVPREKIAVIERWIAQGAATLRAEPERLAAGRRYLARRAGPLGVPARPAAGSAAVPRRRPGADADRCLRADKTPRARLLVRPRGRPAHADPPRVLRPDGSAAVAARARRIPGGSGRRCLRAVDRPPAGLAALRRALGAALAGRRRLCRLRRQRQRRHRAALCLQVPRLCRPRVQRRQAARPFSSSSNLPATSWCPDRGTTSRPSRPETLAATGFLRMAADGTSTGGVDEALASNQVVADTLKIVGSTLLGLTVGCAQCHDHRYDPDPPGRLLPPPRRVRARARPLTLAAAGPASGLALS